MSYEDIVEAQRRRAEKEAGGAKKPGRGRKRRNSVCERKTSKKSRLAGLGEAECEINKLGLEQYCSVLQF